MQLKGWFTALTGPWEESTEAVEMNPQWKKNDE